MEFLLLMKIILGTIVAVSFVLVAVLLILKKDDKKTHKYVFILETRKKTLKFFNPLVNFLVYGGAGSGKTKSVGKPILREYIKHGFAGFVYDYKDEDLTRTTKYLVQKYEYPYSYYQINFVDLNKSHRTNPIDPKVVVDEALFLQCMEDFINNYATGDKNEWYAGAKGIFKGVALRLFRDFKGYCTIPHIINLICLSSNDNLINFLRKDDDAHKQASAYIGAESSTRTMDSYKSTINNYLADLSLNKKIAWVLTGNDFKYNLIDPQEPKMVCFSNSFQIEGIISPIIGLMVTLSSRQFTLKNKVPFVYVLDEATSFKIADFEKMPSVLREYLCSFLLLTQSPAKIEKMYQKHDRSSLEANFGNQFFGRTKEKTAIENFTYLLGKENKVVISKSKGKSRGGESRGTTESTRLENRYDVDFFMDLEPGQFIGTATQANCKRFLENFKMYDEDESQVDLEVNMVSLSEVDNNYFRIIEDVKALLNEEILEDESVCENECDVNEENIEDPNVPESILKDESVVGENIESEEENTEDIEFSKPNFEDYSEM